jgi:hypothetical protein
MTTGSISCFCKLASLAFIVFAIPLEAGADTYTCTGVDKKANLGIASGSVSVSSHDKICDFAVDGVSPTGKQSPEFVNAINQVLSGRIDQNTMNDDQLAALVLGPFVTGRLDGSAMASFHNAFGTSVRGIAGCVAGFQTNPSSTSSSINTNDLVCRVVGGRDNPASFGMIEAQVSQPTLQLGLVFDHRTFVLFIPARLIAAGINGYRLGR